MRKKKKLKRKAKVLIPITIILLIVLFVVGYYEIHGDVKKLSLKLKGPSEITLELGKKYIEKGAKAYYNKKNISPTIKVIGHVNSKKVGKYNIGYKVKYKMVSRKKKRVINIVDTKKPVITLVEDEIDIYQNSTYEEPGVKALDNYDGDISSKIKVDNKIDITKVGTYEVIYKVEDSSGNSAEAKRIVNVVLDNPNQKVAVLNYHFFYDPDKGESCNEEICEKVSDFRSHLEYLKENNFKALTMKEFRDFMYGKRAIPEKSVLITIDDGALGTGKHNGNKLIPILEEYKMHATLFLVTGWWDIKNYQSEYLEVESHTHEMHKENVCRGVTRGAKMLCLNSDEVLKDLEKSISITKSKQAFCFPFYAYNQNAIELVKKAGFELAFIGGQKKATRNTDKYRIPRYVILKQATLEDFKHYVN